MVRSATLLNLPMKLLYVNELVKIRFVEVQINENTTLLADHDHPNLAAWPKNCQGDAVEDISKAN